MRIDFIPSGLTLWVCGALSAALTVALSTGAAVLPLTLTAMGMVLLLLAALLVDRLLTLNAWQLDEPRLTRRMPQALAIGVKTAITLRLENRGERGWLVQLFDHPGPLNRFSGLPTTLTIEPNGTIEYDYHVVPTARGENLFEPAEIRIHSLLRLVWLRQRIGGAELRRVFPDFAQIGRYAWLAGDRRLSEIGIKSWQRRGEGTDFKQLTEYQAGDPIRHIDWKATLRAQRPIVREFQDERDQSVMLLLDCGRRMRAHEFDGGSGHFDQVLNATVLLAYVALKQGDAVGAQTFAVPPEAQRFLAPTKGGRALHGLMAGLYDQQPGMDHPDYVVAAATILRKLKRRSLIVVITNFRDEDSAELGLALQLLRSRHLVMLASVRERALREAMEQPLQNRDATFQIAGAHWFEQRRRNAFIRLAGSRAMMVDAEPAQLGVSLVNAYRAAKTAGLI